MNNVVIENAKIGVRNFSGKEGKFNPPGKRNFLLFLENDLAEKLKNDGWNVKTLKPRSEEDEELPYIQVSVSYDYFPPKIVLVTSKGKTKLEESSLTILDWAEIENVDLIIRPYEWEVNGKTGVKAYVKSMYVTLYEDELETKYIDVPDSALNSISENAD